jgi:hypothetical protein
MSRMIINFLNYFGDLDISDALALVARSGGNRMSKIIAGVVTVALTVALGAASTPEAKAENGQVAAGVAGGLLGGMLLGGALAARSAPPPPVYYAPPPAYIEEPACRMVRERYWDGYDWRFRRVEVCN